MIRIFRFRVFVPTTVVILVTSEFLLVAFCYVLAAFLVLEVDPWVFLIYDGGFLRILPVVLTILFGLHFLDLYTDIGIRSRVGLTLSIGQAVGLAFVVQAALTYANPAWMFPRWLMMCGSAFSLVSLALWRVIYGAIASRTFGTQRLLFLGHDAVVEELAAHLGSHPELGFTNLGYVDETHPAGRVLAGAAVLGPIPRLREIAEEMKPDRIVVGMSERRARLPVHDLLAMKFSGVRIEDASLTYEALRGRVCTKEVQPSQLVFSGELGPRPGLVAVQGLYSWAIALVATILALPLMLLTAVAVKLTSRGPVFYRQTRVGLNGAHFVLYKFRSLSDDAEADTGAVWATRDHPRVTPLGRWLRRLRLDELPQLFNVLRGEVSIVGPRPERPEFVKVLSEQLPYYRQRHCVTPGITGWAQINCKYGETVEDSIVKLEYDLYYIKHLSPALDAYIIFQTLKTMLRLRDAQ